MKKVHSVVRKGECRKTVKLFVKKSTIIKGTIFTFISVFVFMYHKAKKKRKQTNEDILSSNNIGYGNVGGNNIGNENIGYFNITSNAVGIFNTVPTPIYCFNKPSTDFTLKDYEFSDVCNILDSIPSISEKSEEKNYERQLWFDNLPNECKKEIINMPNFDANLFESITGICVNLI